MKISVALCTYNGEKFLREQINSILEQNLIVDEIVVCDDQSTDSTVSILNEYKERHPNIFRIYINEINLKSVKNFEKAIQLCTGDIIFLSDQDDVWEKEKVEKYYTYFESNPSVSVICSNGFGIDENNKKLDVLSVWDIPQIILKTDGEINYFKTLVEGGNFATGAAMAFRKLFIKEVLPFPITDNFHHDEWIALNASYQNEFYFINEKLFSYRTHSNQLVGGVFYSKDRDIEEKLKQRFGLLPAHLNFQEFKRQFRNTKKKISFITDLLRKNDHLMLKKALEILNDKKNSLNMLLKKNNPLYYNIFKLMYR